MKDVVRVRTSCWWDGRSLVAKKEVIPMKRLSSSSALEDAINAVGAKEVIGLIKNLDMVADGLYELVMVDIRRDWESGHIEGCRYQLVPYKVMSNSCLT